MYHLGYDAKRLFQNSTGLGNYSRTLLYHLAQFYPENYYHLFSPEKKPLEQAQVFLQQNNFKTHFYSGGSRSRSLSLGRNAAKEVQLFHGLSNELPFDIKKSGLPSVVTIHDLIFLRYPQQYAWIDRKVYNLKFRHACQKADRIIAISKQTKEDISHFYQIPEEKIQVVYQTCHDRFRKKIGHSAKSYVREHYHLPEEYLLFTGSLSKRKGLLELMYAWSRLPVSLRIPIVVVGEGKAYRKKVEAFLRKERLVKSVYWLGRAKDKDLPVLYRMATALIYPSLYEGFGIPIIEALFCHTPVITNKVAALPEAAGPGALYAEAGQTGSLLLRLTELLESQSLRQKLARAGHQYVERNFSPEKVTKEVMELYQTILSS